MKAERIVNRIVFIAAGVAVLAIIAFIIIGAINIKKGKPENTAADITEEPQSIVNAPNITNIVFLGIDEEENRSDVMMVVSINPDENRVRVISILRDSKVMIEGCRHGTKLGYAYKWGGAQLALETINSNFHTDFNKYITIDFSGMADLIDALGGVEIELTQQEADIINTWMDTSGNKKEYLIKGVNKLNGAQTVVFSRIRKIDGEYARASRQQTVIMAMLESAKKLSKLSYPGLLLKISGCTESNLFYTDILSLFTSLDLNTLEIDKYTIPDENYEENLWGGWETVEGYDAEIDNMIDENQWVWIYDLDAAADRLSKILWGDSAGTGTYSHNGRAEDVQPTTTWYQEEYVEETQEETSQPETEQKTSESQTESTKETTTAASVETESTTAPITETPSEEIETQTESSEESSATKPEYETEPETESETESEKETETDTSPKQEETTTEAAEETARNR